MQPATSEIGAVLRLEKLVLTGLSTELCVLSSGRLSVREIDARLELYGMTTACIYRSIQLIRPDLIELLGQYTSDGETESFLVSISKQTLVMLIPGEERRQLATDGKLLKYCQLREEAYSLMTENI